MSYYGLYNELKGWQPVIGAVLGFGALTWGALYNYRLGRKRDDAIREKEALSVALGLYCEINLIVTELGHLANSLGNWYLRNAGLGDDVPAHFSDGFVLPEPTLYKALAPKIGMLSPEVLMPINRFYGFYGEAVRHLPKVLENDQRQISYGVEWVLDPAISAIDEVQPALLEVERLGNIANKSTVPDLARARQAQALQLEMRPDAHD
jgi:hypothetical protein